MKKTKRSQASNPFVLGRYIEICDAIRDLEAEKKTIRDGLLEIYQESAVEGAYVIGIDHRSRESFNLRTARASLGKTLSEKYINPFTYAIEYKALSVKKLGRK